MKKILSLIIALIMIISVTVMSYGAPIPVKIDLKGATATMINSEGEECFDYFLYMTGEEDDVLLIEDSLRTLRYYLNSNTSYSDGTIMGHYQSKVTYDITSTPGTITYSIKPQIKGFNENTEFLVCAFGQDDNWSSIDSNYVDGEIVFDYESNGIDKFDLVVRESTLDPNGVEPTKEGDEIHVAMKDGIDANGNPVALPIIFVRTSETDSTMDNWFSSIIDNDAYYALINESNDVTKDNLQLLERVEILLLEQEGMAFPIRLTLSNSLINANTVLYPLHNPGNDNIGINPVSYNGVDNEGPNWEIIEYTAGDGEVTLVFDSFSPVALYADRTTLTGYVEPVTPEEPSEPLSPVTGDSDMGYALLIGIIALAGMGIVVKKNY